jgi:hypothetical protein
VAAVLPPANRRTRQTDALEFALVTLLTVMFSPLSFNYAYVWLIYPTTLALHLVISEPKGAPRHRLKVGWITAVVLVPALAVPMPLLAQAYGNLILPALLLVVGLGAMLHSAGRRNPGEDIAASASDSVWHCLFSGFGQECRHHSSGASSATERGGWTAHGSQSRLDLETSRG